MCKEGSVASLFESKVSIGAAASGTIIGPVSLIQPFVVSTVPAGVVVEGPVSGGYPFYG